MFSYSNKKIDNFDEEDNWQPWDERDGSDCQCTQLAEEISQGGKEAWEGACC